MIFILIQLKINELNHLKRDDNVKELIKKLKELGLETDEPGDVYLLSIDKNKLIKCKLDAQISSMCNINCIDSYQGYSYTLHSYMSL